MNTAINTLFKAFKALFDNDYKARRVDTSRTGPDWKRIWPFIFLHLACLAVFFVGISATAVYIALFSYVIRMFAITGFYHRYFSHKAFKTSRPIQFIFAALGTAATQRGPLWWAAHHRHHHRNADTDSDLHAPQKGFWQSHCGWFLSGEAFETRTHLIKDFTRFPELVWLNRYDMVVPVIYATTLFLIGVALEHAYPQLGTNGWQVLVWGYFISTAAVIHATLCINSLAHRYGRRRYHTRDNSRNNLWLALLTLGEGWHNNHHHYQGSARQGFFFWEVDITYYLLRLMAALGLVQDLRPVPVDKKYSHIHASKPEGGASQ